MTPSHSIDTPLQPVLLCDATWYGTLAAVRDLGSRGVPVTLATDSAFAPARWSRYVTDHERCPPTKHPEFLAWLLDFGERRPGHVLYATSDDLAWLIALHARALASRFSLYTPSADTLATLLDKGRCSEAARAAGLLVPETWLPADADEVARIAGTAPFPLLVKPRSQVSGSISSKGERVDRPEDLVATWRALGGAADRQPAPDVDPAASPLIQACGDVEQIYTVDGFVDRAGDMVVLGCEKLLQVPRRRGPGIVFEDAPVPPDLTAALGRLWRSIGFAGVFDAEFVKDGPRLLLIDVNPRFYNHIAFEIDRGMPLPWLAYLAAAGDEARLRSAMRACQDGGYSSQRLYVHRLATALSLALQRLTGKMPADEAQAMRARIARHAGAITDPARDRRDWLPGVVDLAFHLVQFLRHPRAFLMQYARGAGGAPQADVLAAPEMERRASP